MPAERVATVPSGGVHLAAYCWSAPPPDLAGDPGPMARRATVLLVHGYPDTHAVWGPVGEALAVDHRVLAYDVRGAGASGAPGRRSGYRLDALVDDMVAVLDRLAPDERVHLVAHDWGSIQGWHAVTDDRMRDRIASFTSISGPCLDHVGDWMRASLRSGSPRRWAALAGQLLRSWYVGVFHVPGLAPAAWRAGLASGLPRFLALAEGVRPTEADDDVDPWPAPTLAADGRRGVDLYRANFGPRLLRPECRTTAIPTQVIVPLRDRYVSPALSTGLEDRAERLWRRPVAGRHWVIRARPDRVAGWVRELIDHVQDPAAPAAPGLERARSTSNRRRFDDHLVVVTGAGSGIGREVALSFALAGARVVAADIDPAAAERTVTLVDAVGGRARAEQVDVGDTAAMEDFAARVRDDLGAPDVVVNNAGIGMAGNLLDTSVKDWDHILRVNLWGVIHGSRLFGRQMVDRGEGGHIVNVASAAAFSPSRTFGAYAATKAAVLSLTESLRGELGGEGIGVSAVCPGFVTTGIGRATRYVGVDAAEQERRQRAIDRLFRRRGLMPVRVADAIVAGVAADRPVILVGAEARLARGARRFVPGLARRAARFDAGELLRGNRGRGA